MVSAPQTRCNSPVFCWVGKFSWADFSFSMNKCMNFNLSAWLDTTTFFHLFFCHLADAVCHSVALWEDSFTTLCLQVAGDINQVVSFRTCVQMALLSTT